MLTLLHIENIALIESADIRFGEGFNVFTGETGAGKSIVIDSISAVLGERTSRDLIRTGAKGAYVSAVFSGMPNLPWLAENGIAPDENGELLLERELQGDGKNVCRANGRPLTVARLKELGQQLVNIHGQHDGQQLLQEETHLSYLDGFGSTGAELEAYASAYRTVADLRREIAALQMDEAEKSRRIDTLNYQITELERAHLQPGEDEALSAKKEMLRHAGRLMDALAQALNALDGDGEREGAVTLLGRASDAASTARRSIPEQGSQGELISRLSEQLEQLRSDTYDVQENLRDLRDGIDISPEEIDEMESRLDQIYRLQKKYGSTVAEMLDYLAQCREELDQIQYSSDVIARLEEKLNAARAHARKAGAALTRARTAAAEALQQRIGRELADLDMPKVRFQVEILPKGGEDGMDATGMDQVRFLMSANVGEDLKPIQKVASGGELARIMLALKNVLAENDFVSTLIFDEVDTGVSGRAARKVAAKMASVARQKQVLCVTHLPQIAAMADMHFSVEKGEKCGRTYTNVTPLNEENRTLELARLTGGASITETLLASVREMLQQAREEKGR